MNVGALIERLAADLADALPPNLLPKVVLYVAASELLIEEEQPADAGRLRMAVSRLVLESLGVSDSGIERAKVMLATGREPDTLNRRQ